MQQKYMYSILSLTSLSEDNTTLRKSIEESRSN
uniref:Uncharacterized protein n=1 Tax=Amphimedon queenslandica TaxID=400682 RepID=A0A1X7SDD5_AMPQE